MQEIAALCVARNSVYKSLPGVACYDDVRDCRTFPGGMPVVAHPPCGPWSAYCRHQWKVVDGVKELAPWALSELRQWGGVLEHPAHSRLWDEFHLPKPGEPERGGLWSMEVNQAWWGYTIEKKTWLLFSGIDKEALPDIPFRLRNSKGDRRRWAVMSKHQRSATCREFAEWLVEVARRAMQSTQEAAQAAE